ncbi:hypothetical protein HU200_020895 [Digitaria exilis]|uniref:Glycosyltransferase n=1 Tax=Digitaria exilis TaxID=1010633 RepID=A0A835KEQ1_9POAL|nr:hypothetical protein HU200_020895 [Digitaria exilis]
MQRIPDKQLIQGSGESAEKGKVVYNKKGHYSETCEVDGDARVNGMAMSVTLVPTTTSTAEHHQWSIRPYTGKAMSGIKNVTVTQLPDNVTAPPCTVTHTTPAVLFALGGLTGNFWHDFSDVLVPLFVASRRYAGEVQLLITNVQPWFPAAYGTILKGLSKHAAVDLDADDEHVVRCFRHVTVGIHQHKALSIVPEWVPGGHPLSMRDFTRFIREVYVLPRDAPVSLVREPDKKPRLLLIQRGHSRRFMNEPEIVKAAEAVGFDVVVMDLRRDETVDAQARVVNRFDVVVGVHGAGLTNLVFLPPGAVVIQVVPYGRMEMMASLAFGEPATDMGLRYLEYSVTAEESTLLEMLGPEHPAIKDPESMHRSRWDMKRTHRSDGKWKRGLRCMPTTDEINQYVELWGMLQQVQLNDQPDNIIWRFSTNGTYSSSSAYQAQFTANFSDLDWDRLSKTRAENKCKFFGWLLLQNKLWTNDRIINTGGQANAQCPLCCSAPALHMLASCPYAMHVWSAFASTGIAPQQLSPNNYRRFKQLWTSMIRPAGNRSSQEREHRLEYLEGTLPAGVQPQEPNCFAVNIAHPARHSKLANGAHNLGGVGYRCFFTLVLCFSM